MPKRKDLKIAAKEQIKGNLFVFICVLIVWGLILTASAFTYVGELFLLGPLALGIAILVLDFARERDFKFSTAFKGFKQFISAVCAIF